MRDSLANGDEFFAGRHAIRAGFERTALHLTFQPGNPHHEEFVKVGTDNREKLYPLEQRVLFVLRFFKNSRLKSKQAELAVQIK